MSFTDLNTWLNYKNPSVISHFCKIHPEIDPDEAQILFKDLMGWLWVSAMRTQKRKVSRLFGPLLIVDEMWHSFILHTRDYCEFSQTNYGRYIHHDVEPVGREHQMTEDEVVDLLSDCMTYLGEDWVKRRFSEALAQAE